MPKLRVEVEGPGEGVFIARDGEVVQQTISSLILSLSNEGCFLHVGQPRQSLGGMPYEVHDSHPVGKMTIILEYQEG
jgi:hypothetical protein